MGAGTFHAVIVSTGVAVIRAWSGIELVHASISGVAAIIGAGIAVVTLGIRRAFRLDVGLHLGLYLGLDLGPDLPRVLVQWDIGNIVLTTGFRVLDVLDVSQRKLILANLRRHQILRGIPCRNVLDRTGIRSRRATPATRHTAEHQCQNEH
jgi:hypothetical protein